MSPIQEDDVSETRQWPDRICAGPIRYDRATNYEGFCLRDNQHGIPTFGAISERGVHVFNYPRQTEAIARRLVACWNACLGETTEALEARAALAQASPPGSEETK